MDLQTLEGDLPLSPAPQSAGREGVPAWDQPQKQTQGEQSWAHRGTGLALPQAPLDTATAFRCWDQWA